jgi:spectinomycin phosphotransferase
MPVGFGDHHWELTDSAGRRWFVTVADLTAGGRGTDPATAYADLRAAMDTVIALAGAGLEFAVAPVPTTGGRALAPLGAEHAVTVFPYLDGACGDEMPPLDRLAVIDMLARLHNATPLAGRTAPVRRPDLATRPVLEAALGALSQPWNRGPYGEPARRLLGRQASRLVRAQARFDELVRQAARSGPPVITHGEPHPGNILRAAGKLRLVDWDTAGLALPERDLWSVADTDSPEGERYAELTGRLVSTAAMNMYRMRWSLDEIALSLSDLRGPHEQNEDTELTWAVLTEETESLLGLEHQLGGHQPALRTCCGARSQGDPEPGGSHPLTGAVPAAMAPAASCPRTSRGGRRHAASVTAEFGRDHGKVKRVVILGRGGAGKSTLARQLGAVASLPVTELDTLFWQSGLIATDPRQWKARQAELVRRDAWILDGDLGPYDSALDARLEAADTIIVLNFSVWRCAWRTLLRGRERADYWRWVWTYRRQSLPRIMETIGRDAPQARLCVLRHPRRARQLLAQTRREVASAALDGNDG